jgi:hypothetical protein
MTMIQGPPGSVSCHFAILLSLLYCAYHSSHTSIYCIIILFLLTGKTTVAAAIGFGFVQCRTISTSARCYVPLVTMARDNLAEAMIRPGLKVVRAGKPSAVSEVLWDCTLDAAIGRDEAAQKATECSTSNHATLEVL